MLNKTVLKKVSSLALNGAILAVPFLSLVPVNQVSAATPKVEISDTVNTAQADRGETLNYTIVVKNTGDTQLDNVYTQIRKPELADYVAGSSTYIFQPTPNITRNLTDAWINDGVNFGTLYQGEQVTLKYSTKVAQNANTDNIVWSVAAVKTDQTAQISASAWTRVILKNPGLTGEVTADKTSVAKGDVVTFTIKAHNSGNIVLNDVFVGDVINAPFKYVPGSTQARIGSSTTNVADAWLTTGFNAGYLNPGQEVIVTFKVTVGEVTDGQVLKNVASIKSNETKQFNCEVVLKAKVLGVVTPPTPTTPATPTQLPNTGPGEIMLLVSGLVPAGWALKKFKSKI